jgi:hypothetical protein
MLPYPLWLISSRKGSRYTQVRFLAGVLAEERRFESCLATNIKGKPRSGELSAYMARSSNG